MAIGTRSSNRDENLGGAAVAFVGRSGAVASSGTRVARPPSGCSDAAWAGHLHAFEDVGVGIDPQFDALGLGFVRRVCASPRMCLRWRCPVPRRPAGAFGPSREALKSMSRPSRRWSTESPSNGLPADLRQRGQALRDRRARCRRPETMSHSPCFCPCPTTTSWPPRR